MGYPPPGGPGAPPPGAPPPGGYQQGAAANHGLGRRAQEIPLSHTAANQLWVYENGYVKSRYNGMVLDVKGGEKKHGTEVICWHANGGRNQLWDFTPDGYLVSRDTGHVIDIPHGKIVKDAKLIVWDKKDPANPDSLNQRWTWDDYGFIASMKNPYFVIDLAGRSDKPGAHAILWEKHSL